MEGTPVLTEQRNNGTHVQTVQLPRPEILSHKGHLYQKTGRTDQTNLILRTLGIIENEMKK